MGLFDSLKNVGEALRTSVNSTVNDYKEKKEFKVAEREMFDSIAEKQHAFMDEHISELNEKNIEPVVNTAILSFDSFKKEGFADAYDIIEANITGEEIAEWAVNYSNADEINTANNEFYKKYCIDALASDWYKDSVAPFYGEDAERKLVMMLTVYLHMDLPDKTKEVVYNLYGGDDGFVGNFLEVKKYDFYNPLVAFVLGIAEDEDTDILDHYEKNCLKRYTNMTRNMRLDKYRLRDSEPDVYQIKLKDENTTYCAAIRDNCFSYMQISFHDVKRISDLRKYANLEATKIPLSEVLYWKECGEFKKEVGVKKENAVVNVYAAAKGVVLPKQLEERTVDTRFITLAFEHSQMELDYRCLDAIKKLLPEYAFDRVQVKKPSASVHKEDKSVEQPIKKTEDGDIVAAFEKLQKLKNMNLISDKEYADKKAELMNRI